MSWCFIFNFGAENRFKKSDIKYDHLSLWANRLFLKNFSIMFFSSAIIVFGSFSVSIGLFILFSVALLLLSVISVRSDFRKLVAPYIFGSRFHSVVEIEKFYKANTWMFSWRRVTLHGPSGRVLISDPDVVKALSSNACCDMSIPFWGVDRFAMPDIKPIREMYDFRKT